MNKKVFVDFGITRYDLLEIIREAGRALDPSENEIDIRGARKRLEVAYMILQGGVLDKYMGNSFFITYRLPHAAEYENPYVCTDYDDLQRVVDLEQEGKCKITSINGVEWDKDEYEYYFGKE